MPGERWSFMSVTRIAGLMVASLVAVQATTLEQLSLDDMVNKSTAIVRGRVGSSYAQQHGLVIFTHYKVQVLERWKGPAASEVDVAVPGGMLGGKTQTVAGAPALAAGDELVFFLWTGKSGLTQVMGLSQGALALETDSSGQQYVTRAPSSESMVNPAGQTVRDSGVRMQLGDFHSRVARTMAAGGGVK